MSTVKAANLQNTGSGAPAFKNSSGTEIGQLCKAWIQFNGTGTVSIRESFNFSSLTDNGTGDYTANFTNSMADANYCVVGMTSESGTPNRCMVQRDDSTPVNTSVRLGVFATSSNTNIDQEFNSAAVFR